MAIRRSPLSKELNIYIGRAIETLCGMSVVRNFNPWVQKYVTYGYDPIS